MGVAPMAKTSVDFNEFSVAFNNNPITDTLSNLILTVPKLVWKGNKLTRKEIYKNRKQLDINPFLIQMNLLILTVSERANWTRAKNVLKYIRSDIPRLSSLYTFSERSLKLRLLPLLNQTHTNTGVLVRMWTVLFKFFQGSTCAYEFFNLLNMSSLSYFNHTKSSFPGFEHFTHRFVADTVPLLLQKFPKATQSFHATGRKLLFEHSESVEIHGAGVRALHGDLGLGNGLYSKIVLQFLQIQRCFVRGVR